MKQPDCVVVAGASTAGLATAEALRRQRYEGNIVVVGAEGELPYDRSPLSRQVLAGTWEREQAELRSGTRLHQLGIDLVLGERAASLDVDNRTVHTASGMAIAGDAVVIATGARPRTLPGVAVPNRVHVLRTLDDAVALRARVLTSERLVVVGDGVLGSEIAATAREMGREVTLVGPSAGPLAGRLGPEIAQRLAELHRERGVCLLPGAVVEGFGRKGARVTSVRLATGEAIPADAVVVAIGADPATEWLEGSGLALDNGVSCDSRLRAAAGVYAAGDIARFHHERLGESIRLQNRANAIEQAAVVAANLLGADEAYAPIPSFRTEQFGARIDMHGFRPAGATADIIGGVPGDRHMVVRYRLGDRTTGVAGWNMPEQARRRRADIAVGSMEAA
ncbi:NAD(P)/FAD-dependent oxidoreductase [Nocardia carnea]|uniref:NAD(P)/FAD-dependent oxidoreductase n=1 Tax=Nocardia carnea TaxID=37328 RepID=UPI00245465A8|nr:NAD(P)/FAD-dependent oxidoreductase [Nocardia carnea]